MRLGISKIDEYATAFGLGEKQELKLQSPQVFLHLPKQRNNGGIWNAGDTLQTAIGQSDNLFTPLQLANYCSTVANGGTRYELHFVKSIISSASGNVNEKTKSVAESVGLSQSTINTVHQGMRLVATNGGPYLVFSNMKTKVACKQVLPRLR